MIQRIKNLILGNPLDPHDQQIFHNLSLIAFFAWVGLGADGLSSSCYGPEEAFLALGRHAHLSIFVALGAVLTIFVISSSYSQIIELFPTGGGGYLVASKLLNPTLGMVSGCALLIDYILTITISVASGADALFSFFPAAWLPFKLEFAMAGVILLILLNLRGVKESVIPLVPVFLTFVFTHAFAILYGLGTHLANFPAVAHQTLSDVRATHAELGWIGMGLMILRAYSLGAGTYTGIEAVSNGLPILREPKVQTGKRTMHYMALSLGFTVFGLMLTYLLWTVGPEQGKTLNAVLFGKISATWPAHWGTAFVLITLFSEATLLFVAAQAGFVDGPRVLSNMALDRWFPSRFTMLSDRFVSQNGVLIMGGSALAVMLLTRGSVGFLVVLYSINVFITFTLSQLGMVRHWWEVRKAESHWKKRIFINGLGFLMTSFILISMTALKFDEGGWITLLLTGALIGLAFLVKHHYRQTALMLKRLENLVLAAGPSAEPIPDIELNKEACQDCDPQAKTAVVLVNGFNGLGLHTLFGVIRLFGGSFKNFVFLEVGVIDAGTFKGAAEVEHLQGQVGKEVNRYVDYMRRHGYYAEGISAIANDVVDEVAEIAPRIIERFPNVVFFGGQLVFPDDSFWTRILHNYTVFAMQRRFYHTGIPMVVLPIRV